MIQISQIKIEIPHTKERLKEKVLKLLRVREKDLISFRILKKSLDARKKPQLYHVYTVAVEVKNEERIKKYPKNAVKVDPSKTAGYTCEATGTEQLKERPIIIGTGPAGLFCGYQLAKLGYRPLLLERGAAVDDRIADVEKFWKEGVLNKQSNVQFGEGGAGTFSDGKLNTLVNDKFGRNQEVLRIFTKYGAPDKIQYESKPHIGTDVLAKVVKNMRTAIEVFGGEVKFHSQVTNLRVQEDGEGRKLSAIEVLDSLTGETQVLQAELVVLAIGHSARDTFEMLLEQQIPMEAKPFAVGVRVEHPQTLINESQYGIAAPEDLSAAPYKLAVNLENGRGVYTFCMCPGGYVVNASSEEQRLAVNGMSYSGRDGKNANSAVIVTVTPEDYGVNGILSGMEFQRTLEANAYQEGKGKIPVQLFEDFCQNQPSKGPGEFLPQLKGEYTWANVRAIFPEFLSESLEEGIRQFDHKIHGYARKDAILSGVESRTSSPVRIMRDETLQSKVRGLYPCGEGAGYAGGITSAAMDGLKVAEQICQNYRPFDKCEQA